MERAREHLGHVDVLVNDAAIDYDTDQRAATADLERVERAWQSGSSLTLSAADGPRPT
jgi:NAD(P)-dependent dehydrogenase (short-subunit alcohol dehydrogenase family)